MRKNDNLLKISSLWKQEVNVEQLLDREVVAHSNLHW